jgi:hypothetical protein
MSRLRSGRGARYPWFRGRPVQAAPGWSRRRTSRLARPASVSDSARHDDVSQAINRGMSLEEIIALPGDAASMPLTAMPWLGTCQPIRHKPVEADMLFGSFTG